MSGPLAGTPDVVSLVTGPSHPVGSDLACLSLSFHRKVGIDVNVFE